MKQNFLFCKIKPFILDFITQTLQYVRITLAVDCFFFLKIGNENYETLIPKNWRHDLACRWMCLCLFWGRFSPLSLLVWLFFHLRCELIDPCFIHGYALTKNLPLLLWNFVKHSIETFTQHCFGSPVNNRGIHLAQRFPMPKFAFNVQYAAFFEILTMFVSSRTFSRRLCNTVLWIFFVISGVFTLFGWP